MRKPGLTILASLLLTTAFGQFKPQGTFVGVEEISAMNERTDLEHPKHKWYHLSVLSFKGDSVFLEQSPVSIYKTDTIFSASDGGFYSYAGIVRKSEDRIIADLELKTCDYCPSQFIRFDPPKVVHDDDTTQLKPIDTGITEQGDIIEDITYKYKILILERAKSVDEIIVNKNVYRRQKKHKP